MKMYKKGDLILMEWGERCANRIVLVVAVATESLNIPLCGGDYIAKAIASLFQNDSIVSALAVEWGGIKVREEEGRKRWGVCVWVRVEMK